MHGSARTRVQCDSWHLLLPPIAKGEPSVPTAGPSVVSFVMECECRVQSSARAPNITAGVVRGERDDDARCVAHWSRRLRVFRLPVIGSASWGCSGFGIYLRVAVRPSVTFRTAHVTQTTTQTDATLSHCEVAARPCIY